MIPMQGIKLGFWPKFWELQYKMLLAHHPLQSHMYSSEPLEWPLVSRTVAYWIDSNSNVRKTEAALDILHLCKSIGFYMLNNLELLVFSKISNLGIVLIVIYNHSTVRLGIGQTIWPVPEFTHFVKTFLDSEDLKNHWNTKYLRFQYIMLYHST